MVPGLRLVGQVHVLRGNFSDRTHTLNSRRATDSNRIFSELRQISNLCNVLIYVLCHIVMKVFFNEWDNHSKNKTRYVQDLDQTFSIFLGRNFFIFLPLQGSSERSETLQERAKFLSNFQLLEILVII